MKPVKVLQLLVYILLGCNGRVSVAAEHPIDLKEIQCIVADSSTAGMANCTSLAEADWDQEMNKYYGLLVKSLNKDQADQLRQAQRAWVQYRDKEFKSITALFSDNEGTMWIPIRAAHYKDIVKQRAVELMEYRRLLDDSDDELIQARWGNGQLIASADLDLANAVDMKGSGGNLVLTCGKSEVAVKTCLDYYDALNKECFASTTYDMTMQTWFMSDCDTRKDLLEVKSSRVSYLKEILSGAPEKIFRKFNLLPYIDKAMVLRKGQNWLDGFDNFKAYKDKGGVLVLELSSEGLRVHLTIQAFGDFNADGIEDVNVFLLFKQIGGTSFDTYNFWFSAQGTGEMLERVDL